MVSVAVLATATFYPDSGLFRGSELGKYFLITAKAASWVAPSDVRQMFHDGAAVWRKTEISGSKSPQPDEKKPASGVNNAEAKTK